jgi:hypothetical protein
MTTSSVSFRITRHTEDLAQTIHALSQRVVQLEQRLAGLEAQLLKDKEEVPAEHLTSLAHVDQLLRDCHELLAGEQTTGEGSPLNAPPRREKAPQAANEILDDLEEAA